MPSLLLIDDDDLFRDLLATALTERGYVVRQARDGEQGLKSFRSEPADVVLTDIVMPNKEGIAVVQELRRGEPKPGIIAMSGGLGREAQLYLKIAGALGATRTLQKPFELATVLAAIEAVLAGGGQIEATRRTQPADR